MFRADLGRIAGPSKADTMSGNKLSGAMRADSSVVRMWDLNPDGWVGLLTAPHQSSRSVLIVWLAWSKQPQDPGTIPASRFA